VNGAEDGSYAEANLKGQHVTLRGCTRALRTTMSRKDRDAALEELAAHWESLLEGFPHAWKSEES